jgi:LysM repeat protein
MVDARTRTSVARVAAPALFLVAVTIAVLVIRAALVQNDAGPRSGPAATTSGSATSTYVIAPGDTLAGIAQRYGTTVEALVALNPDVDPVSLRIGQRITVG